MGERGRAVMAGEDRLAEQERGDIGVKQRSHLTQASDDLAIAAAADVCMTGGRGVQSEDHGIVVDFPRRSVRGSP